MGKESQLLLLPFAPSLKYLRLRETASERTHFFSNGMIREELIFQPVDVSLLRWSALEFAGRLCPLDLN